jgi:hypothetical protein
MSGEDWYAPNQQAVGVEPAAAPTQAVKAAPKAAGPVERSVAAAGPPKDADKE